MVNVRRVEMMVTRMLGYENGKAVVQHTNTSKTGKPEWSTRKCWFRRESSWASAALMLMALVLSYRTQCRVRSRAKRRLGVEWVSEASQSLSFGWSRQCSMWSSSRSSSGGGGWRTSMEWEARKKTFFSLYFSEGKKVVDVFVIF